MQVINKELQIIGGSGQFVDSIGSIEENPSILIGTAVTLKLNLLSDKKNSQTGELLPLNMNEVAANSYYLAIDSDYKTSTPLKILRLDNISIEQIEGETILTAVIPETNTTELQAAVTGVDQVKLFCEIGGYDSSVIDDVKPKRTFAFQFGIIIRNSIYNPNDDEPTSNPSDYYTAVETNAKLNSKEVYQFSIDGVNNWHETQTDTDLFYRSRKEATPNGEWSDPIKLLRGADGNDGLNGTNGTDGAPGENGTNGIDGQDGNDGDSAFQIAVNNGFVGSESEWLQSLKGADGSINFEDLTDEQKATLKGEKGEKGDAFVYEDFTAEQLESLKGPSGSDAEVTKTNVDLALGASESGDQTKFYNQNGEWVTVETDTGGGSSSKVFNDNLLINSEGRINHYLSKNNGSNKRYFALSSGYFIDRHYWTFEDEGSVNNNLDTGARTIDPGGPYLWSLEQKFDAQDMRSLFSGQVTAHIQCDIDCTINIVLVNNSNVETIIDGTVNTDNSVTFNIPEFDSNFKTFVVRFTAYQTAVITNFKLEIGDKHTGYKPNDLALELAKCQRYYEEIGETFQIFLNENSENIMLRCAVKRVDPTIIIDSHNSYGTSGGLPIINYDKTGMINLKKRDTWSDTATWTGKIYLNSEI
ncbi:hypothetical protein AAEX28_02440 [Lentisphaerota bacterium WC36G]|nr:hypothetical protein LJT99_05325 [Lentisphaerae bacterium WC36]